MWSGRLYRGRMDCNLCRQRRHLYSIKPWTRHQREALARVTSWSLHVSPGKSSLWGGRWLYHKWGWSNNVSVWALGDSYHKWVHQIVGYKSRSLFIANNSLGLLGRLSQSNMTTWAFLEFRVPLFLANFYLDCRLIQRQNGKRQLQAKYDLHFEFCRNCHHLCYCKHHRKYLLCTDPRDIPWNCGRPERCHTWTSWKRSLGPLGEAFWLTCDVHTEYSGYNLRRYFWVILKYRINTLVSFASISVNQHRISVARSMSCFF